MIQNEEGRYNCGLNDMISPRFRSERAAESCQLAYAIVPDGQLNSACSDQQQPDKSPNYAREELLRSKGQQGETVIMQS